jgi:carbon storage regulator
MSNLVLSRKKDETICIGDRIRVKVVEIRGGNSVRLSVQADRDIPIHRLEVYEAIQAEQQTKPAA